MTMRYQQRLSVPRRLSFYPLEYDRKRDIERRREARFAATIEKLKKAMRQATKD